MPPPARGRLAPRPAPSHLAPVSETPLRRGWTTGACATAATRAALSRLWSGAWPDPVTIRLPRGETPSFPLAHRAEGPGWAEAGIVKDAGDDPDVTHGALILARVAPSAGGVRFRAGEGVGTVTMPGLPVPPGEPAINPVPRAMMEETVAELASEHGRPPDVEITVSVPGGAALAARTWNPRLGIVGGLSILGTTGIVRPFSCAAWIASIHRGIDVARAAGLPHVAGCTGATSEAAVRALHALPLEAMIDMGDFAGGMLKYLRRHPVPRVTVGGGIAKMAKLAQGALDLHSARSQVDMARLAEWAGDPALASAPTALAALEAAGPALAARVAEEAQARVSDLLGASAAADVVVVDRAGRILGRAGP
nr:cobalt-precorrin-5B (C(1))-methyltransferase [Rubellimicrobium sp. CFH 75288]